MRSFLALAIFALGACAAASPDYRVGGLGAGWKELDVQGSDVTFKHQDGGTIFANRQCQSVEDVPLEVLTNHLFFDMRIDRELSKKEITLAGRGALRTHVIAELDGVPVELDVVVLKKDGCTYDLALVADRREFAERQPDFEAFLRGFDEVEIQKGRG